MCTVKLDRLEFSSAFGPNPPTLPGFFPEKVKPDIFLRRRSDAPCYTRVKRQYNPTTGTRVSIRSSPTGTLLKPLKATLIANDAAGITAKELWTIIEAFDGKHCITLAESAFDFQPNSGVCLEFVKRYGVFGKSRPEEDPRYAITLRFGTRKSSRFVRCYWKEGIDAFRVEVQITSRWLRESNDDSRTVYRLRSLCIFPNDFFFARLSWDALVASLHRSGRLHEQIITDAKKREASIHSLLSYLRNEAGIRNPDRFLRPLKINREIALAWRHWTWQFAYKSISRKNKI